MDQETALGIMQRYVAELNSTGSIPVRETDFRERIRGGWVFYFNSVEYLETGRFEAQLVGQGPVIVLDDGSIIRGGSADRPEDVMRRHGR